MIEILVPHHRLATSVSTALALPPHEGGIRKGDRLLGMTQPITGISLNGLVPPVFFSKWPMPPDFRHFQDSLFLALQPQGLDGLLAP